MLKVSNIDVAYGDVQVLWDVSFEVREQEILVLVGANGAGKSTTLRTISGLLRPLKGSIEFKGSRLDQIRITASLTRASPMCRKAGVYLPK